jgi:hypothetical protein
MDSIFIFLDRIYPASLNRPFGQEALDRLSYAEARRIDGIFSPAARGPSAEGRFILTILLILSNCFSKIRIHSSNTPLLALKETEND